MSISDAITAYEDGKYTRALKTFKPMAESGNAVAQNYLGIMYKEGGENVSDSGGIEQSPTEAVKWFRKAAEQGYADAQLNLAGMCIDGSGTEQNDAEGMEWLQKAAKQGNDAAQYSLGEVYLAGNIVKKDIAEGVKWLREAGEHGHDFNTLTFAWGHLAEMYRKGDGVQRDVVEAIKWLRKAAEQGRDSAAYELGQMYLDGKEVQQDYIEAAKWFRQAADGQYLNSHNRLARMYLDGLGVSQDDAEAAKWLCKGAELYDPTCMKALAGLYKKGVRLQQEECKAIEWFRKAEEEGNADLQLYLGLRNRTIREYLNSLNLFVGGGLLTMAILTWYDWVSIDRLVAGPEAQVSWYFVLSVAAIGFFVGPLLSQNVFYRIDTYNAARGIPFPTIRYQPRAIDNNEWIDFTGGFTLVSLLLNACYYALVIVALLLALTDIF